MKKYLLTSIISLTISVVIIIHLYKTKDIEWIDSIVEYSSSTLGIEPSMVTKKVQRKIQQKKDADLVLNAAQQLVISETVMPDKLETIDSANSFLPTLTPSEKKPRKLFNVEITPPQPQEQVKKVDSVAASALPDIKPQKRKLFNASIDRSESAQTSGVKSKVVYFKAEVNRPQRFDDDQEIAFRTSEPIQLGGSMIPEKIVFSAKANVFDGRIHFIVKSINNVSVRGENYKEQLPGMPIVSELKLDESYFLSEGFPVVFGIQL